MNWLVSPFSSLLMLTDSSRRCEWFKLLLSPESLRSGQPDPRLPPLPYGKTVVDVISDFLREIWRYSKRQITEEIGSVADLGE